MNVGRRQIVLFQRFDDEQPLVGESIGYCDGLSFQVVDRIDCRVFVHHHRAAVSMAEINDSKRHAIFPKLHGEWGENESGRRLSGKKSFFQLWPTLKSQRLKLGSTGYLLVNEIGNWTGEMTSDRQESDSERFVAGEPRKNVKIKREVEGGDYHKGANRG